MVESLLISCVIIVILRAFCYNHWVKNHGDLVKMGLVEGFSRVNTATKVHLS